MRAQGLGGDAHARGVASANPAEARGRDGSHPSWCLAREPGPPDPPRYSPGLPSPSLSIGLGCCPCARRRQKASDEELTSPPRLFPRTRSPPWRVAPPPSSPTQRAAAPPPSSPTPRTATASSARCAPGRSQVLSARRVMAAIGKLPFFSPSALRGSTTRWTCPTLGRAPRNRPRVSLLVPRRLTAPSLPLSSPSRRSPSARAS